MVDGVNELHSGLLLQVDVSFRFRLQLDFRALHRVWMERAVPHILILRATVPLAGLQPILFDHTGEHVHGLDPDELRVLCHRLT